MCSNPLSEALQELLGDPLLSDLPEDVDCEEVRAQLALVNGHAMTLRLVREDSTQVTVTVLQNCKVSELQRAVKRQIIRTSPDLPPSFSWRSFWRRYTLTLSTTALSDPKSLVAHYGVQNNSLLRFTKRVRRNNKHFKHRQ